MQAILAMVLNAAVSYIQTPAGQERLMILLPSVINGLGGLVNKIKDAPPDQQKQVAAAHVLELIQAAAAQADADHAANPTDAAFAPGVFRND